MAHPNFPPLPLPAVDATCLRKGSFVQTRYFFADSIPGRRAEVVRVRQTPKGPFVRCNYGKNLSGQSLLKWMPADALASIVD